jgi:protein-tyrosine phosphatase
MIDFHSHILPGVDDGFKSMDDSLEELKIASEEGITDIVLTPHYICDSSYSSSASDNKKIFNKLVKQKDKLGINVNLYLSNEIYINDNIDKLIKSKKINPINNKYLLIELPLNNNLINAENIIFDLISKGYKVILAHPERYMIFKKDRKRIDKYLSMGVMLQGNYKSLFGKYGKEAKKLLKYLLKTKKITFLGSDIHKNESYRIKSLSFRLKIMGLKKEYIEDILFRNSNILLTTKEKAQ